MLLQCSKLLSMGLSERKEILEKSGLCLFCLKHAAELECYGRGGLSKPRCTQDGCDGEYTPSVHRLVREESAGVNFVTEVESDPEDEGKDEDEDEGWWVSTVGAMETWESEEETAKEAMESESEEKAHPPRPAVAPGGQGPDRRRWLRAPWVTIPPMRQGATSGGTQGHTGSSLR